MNVNSVNPIGTEGTKKTNAFLAENKDIKNKDKFTIPFSNYTQVANASNVTLSNGQPNSVMQGYGSQNTNNA